MTADALDVSIVVPTFERPDAIVLTLRTLARIDPPAGGWETVVVDDGSSASTLQTLREAIAALDIRVRLLEQQRRGPAAARNAGAAAARGRVLVFIDNDILVERDFLRRHLDVLERNPGCWVIGRIVHPPELRATPFGRYRDFRWEEFHRAEGVRGLTVTTGMSAANLALPAVDFRRCGGFDEAFSIASCEDFELGLRARQAGVRVLYDPDNVVVHNDWAVTLPAFCERQRLYSISDVLLYRKYGEASPRALMVRENGVGTTRSPRIKRGIKRVLATGAGRRLLQGFCRVLERVVPDSRYTRCAYDLAIAVAIFRGVREGIRRYPMPQEDMRAA